MRSYSGLDLLVGGHFIIEQACSGTLRYITEGATKLAINYTGSVAALTHGVVLVPRQMLSHARCSFTFLP
jgi:hypothetical protein